METKDVINYRLLYEQSVCMLAYNIMKDISAMLVVRETIKFDKNNRFKFNGKKKNRST